MAPREEKISLFETRDVHEKKPAVLKSNFAKVLEGFACTLLNLLCHICSTTSAQLTENRIPHFQFNILRQIIPICGYCVVFVATKHVPQVPRDERAKVAGFTLTSFAYSVSLYTSVVVLPFSSVQSSLQTVNIVAGLLLFFVVLKERATPLLLASALMSICGVLLVIQPGALKLLMSR